MTPTQDASYTRPPRLYDFPDHRRYRALDIYLKETFGTKVYKIALDGGMSCPNRDGTLGTGGCIFCSGGGSGEFAASRRLSITEQIDSQIALAKAGQTHASTAYIAYFQAYTNTYAPVDVLERLFTEAILDPRICALSIATRPDCLPDETIQLLTDLQKQKPVWIELGLQTIHEKTAQYIRRGYPLSCFTDTVARLHAAGLSDIIVHTILGLPGETEADVLDTVRFLNTQSIQGIKLQLLHVLQHTDLATDWKRGVFETLTQTQYTDLVIHCLEILSPDIVIHRLTGDGPKDLLLAPTWSLHKRNVLNGILHELKTRDTWQGRCYSSDIFCEP